MLFKLIVSIATIFYSCDGANILGIVATPSYSHTVAFKNLWNKLSLNGHKVTLLTPDPQNNPNLTNLTEIDLSIAYGKSQEEINWPPKNIENNPVNLFNFFSYWSIELINNLFSNIDEVRNLIKNSKSMHFDVVMAESFKPEFLIFGELFQAPTILLTSFEESSDIQSAFQNDYHSILYPDMTVPYAGNLSFTERLTNVIIHWSVAYIKYQTNIKKKQILDEYFDTKLSIDDMIKKCSMLFISVSPVLLYPRPLSPRTVIIGGGTTIKPPEILEKNIQKFLNSAKVGVIYFSLGSNAKSENLGDKTIKDLIEIFKHLPYSILWKFKNNGSYVMPDNVMTVTWLAQQDVLRHPNVKLFITQGGMQSLEEAVYFQKPMVGIPMFADQESNLKRVQESGILKYVASKPSINPNELKQAILEVIENEKYLETIKRLHKINLDQPMSGLEKAVWWTEYVIRHKGNVDHMVHKPALIIPFYQYYYLDVLLFLFLALLSILVIFYFIFSYMLKYLLSKKQQINEKKIL